MFGTGTMTKEIKNTSRYYIDGQCHEKYTITQPSMCIIDATESHPSLYVYKHYKQFDPLFL